ncbi:MAG: hypothetical protein JWQ35_1639 [Bacteriovoracaceae bacterium]|nr:hypothetical protein [Bacteriovoracaceae bacterium]
MKIFIFKSVFLLTTCCIASKLHAQAVCSPPRSALMDGTNSVLQYLDEKMATVPPPKEFLIERDVHLNGIFGKQLILDLRLPDSDAVIGKVFLSEFQSYRGLEVVKVEVGHATLKARDGKLFELYSGSSDWAKVMVLGERRDQYSELIANALNMTDLEYVKRVSSITFGYVTDESAKARKVRAGASQIVSSLPENTPGPQNYDDKVAKILNYTVTRDERNVRGLSSEIVDCEKFVAENGSEEKAIETPWGRHEYVFLSCLVPGREQKIGVCCGAPSWNPARKAPTCVEKQVLGPDQQTAEHPCGPNDEICPHETTPPVATAYDNLPCTSSNDDHSYNGVCYSGKCYQCVQTGKPCKESIGKWEQTDQSAGCVFDPLPTGALCDKGKVCLNDECVPYGQLVSSEVLKANPMLAAIFSNRMGKDNKNLDDELKELSSFLDELGSGTCTDLNIPNGTSCSTPGAPAFSQNCFDGHCKTCDPNSDLKYENAPACPKSLTWPTRKGHRLSCADPDICIYN